MNSTRTTTPLASIGIEHAGGHFSADLEAGLEVADRERFEVFTRSLLTDGAFDRSDRYETMAIPVTGPVRVAGARAGDTLRVDVHAIHIADRGAMVTLPGRGGFSGTLGRSGRAMDIVDGFVIFDEDTHIPVRPMVGKLGVAVPGAAPISSTVGPFGGNMDCRELAAGCSILLPVHVDGALLYAGDLHATQGDGECSLTAVEVEGSVELSAGVEARITVERPIIVTPEAVITVGDGKDLDEAARVALDDMLALVMQDRGWSRETSAMFLSAAADVAVCQLVNPRASVRVTLPALYFRSPELRAVFSPTTRAPRSERP